MISEEKFVNSSNDKSNFSTQDLPLNGMRILIVDDSPDNQFLIEYFLSSNGANVYFANDGSEAIGKALVGSFDLVLMDIEMPKMDGYQAAKNLMNRGYETPIVALSAHVFDEKRDKTSRFGFSGHLSKPFHFNELLQTVVRYGSIKNYLHYRTI